MKNWPVPVTELVLIGHSMGGLVARSACHYGALAQASMAAARRTRSSSSARRITARRWSGAATGWSPAGRRAAYSAPLARLGKIRSAGITDLRYGNLVDEDWKRRDRFARGGDRRVPVPLPEGVACFAIAASTGKSAGDLPERLIGDGIVPLESALGHHTNPKLAVDFDHRASGWPTAPITSICSAGRKSTRRSGNGWRDRAERRSVSSIRQLRRKFPVPNSPSSPMTIR